MTEFQVTSWRELPSMVAARDETGVIAKTQLPARFLEAIDEAAMRLGDTSSEDYLAGWTRTGWTPAEGSPDDVVDAVVADLVGQWSPERVTAYLDTLG